MKPLKEQTNSELIETLLDLHEAVWQFRISNKIIDNFNEARAELESRLNAPKMEWKDIKDAPVDKLVNVYTGLFDIPATAYKVLSGTWFNCYGFMDYHWYDYLLNYEISLLKESLKVNFSPKKSRIEQDELPF
jgi:hypothetical protein